MATKQVRSNKQDAASTVAQKGAPAGVGSQHPHQGKTLTGAQSVISSLEAEGVDILFGYPGGAALRIYDALYEAVKLNHILARHEQGAVHEADGYARSTGKVGVVLVTSGPGATNTVTGIATAYMDSIPLVVITTQVPRSAIGTDSFQESDIFGITMPIVKHSYLIKDVEDIPRTIREAFHIAKTGRPGPVLIDIPSDVLKDEAEFFYPDEANIPSYRPTYKGNAKQIKAAAELIAHSQRPIFYVGGGAISSGASSIIQKLMDTLEIPCVVTLMAKGAVPSSDPLNLGLVGMHGSYYANKALNDADLIIACGARFSDRVTGTIDAFAPEAKLIHIDIDPAEIGKVREAQVPIVGDLRTVLETLESVYNEDGLKAPNTKQWLKDIKGWQKRYPLVAHTDADRDGISPEHTLQILSDLISDGESIVVTEVGQHQMWAAQFMQREDPRTFLSSGGLGTMGFGFPAALGAALGNPSQCVICIAGDGSFQMNMQEMVLATEHQLNIKVVLFDNRTLGMVRQWQDMFCDKRFSQTNLSALPDFTKLADAYGWSYDSVSEPNKVKKALQKMLATPGPYLLDVKISPECSVSPMVPPGTAISDALANVPEKPTGKKIEDPARKSKPSRKSSQTKGE